MTYRPDIDGLRAIAVLSVVLYHLGAPGVSGGFVGVDVFFVISGYLITRIISEEMARGTFSVARFYERRIRRIFPALFCMLGLCWLVATWMHLPLDFEAFSASLIASSLSGANILFWKEAGYFAAASELKPLLHTWSLAVEEQFYLVFPLFASFVRRRWPERLVVSLWLLAVVSFVACLAATEQQPSLAFFIAPFRAWELLAGALLAANAVPTVPRRWLAEGIAAGGFALLLGPILLYSSETVFPGVAAAPPVLGTAMVIHANTRSRTFVARLLATPPLVGLGLISYSVYLYHWPLIAFARYYLSEPFDAGTAAALGCGSLLLGWASWRWIEMPFRKRRGDASARRVFAGACGAVAMAVLAGLGGVLTQGWPSRLSQPTQRYAAMLDKRLYFPLYQRGTCFLDYDQTARDYDIARCASFPKPDDSGRLEVLLFGDSFAAHLFPGLDVAPELVTRQYTATSCRPTRGGGKRCDAIYERFVQEVAPYSRPDVILVAGHWQPSYERIGREAFMAALRDSLLRLRETGARVFLVGQSPTFNRPIPSLLATHPNLRSKNELRITAADASALNAELSALANSLSIGFFEPYHAACDAQECLAAVSGEPFHWDNGHLTRPGSEYYVGALLPLLRGASSAR